MGINSPVVDVYNQHRTARLNVRYLEAVLKKTRLRFFIFEYVIALTASSTAASAWFFQGNTGQIFWKILTGLTALLAVARPFLNLPARIHKYEEMLIGYKSLDFDLERLGISIRDKKCYDKELRDQFKIALDKKAKLIEVDKDESPDGEILEKCYQVVLLELPEDSFYLPPEN